MNKLSLLAGVAAVALMAGAAQATDYNTGGVTGLAHSTGFAGAGNVTIATGTGPTAALSGASASSNTTSTLTRDCGSNCVTARATTENTASFFGFGYGDKVFTAGAGATLGTTETGVAAWDVDGRGNDGAVAFGGGKTVSGTGVIAIDAGHGEAGVVGVAETIGSSYNEACASEYGNTASATVKGVSAFDNFGYADSIHGFSAAGSFGYAENYGLALTWAKDSSEYDVCRNGCRSLGEAEGYGKAFGGAGYYASATSVDGDVGYHGAAAVTDPNVVGPKTVAGIAGGKASSLSTVDVDPVYGKIGEKAEWKVVGRRWVEDKNRGRGRGHNDGHYEDVYDWVNTPVYGTKGVTVEADTKNSAEAFAGADGNIYSQSVAGTIAGGYTLTSGALGDNGLTYIPGDENEHVGGPKGNNGFGNGPDGLTPGEIKNGGGSHVGQDD